MKKTIRDLVDFYQEEIQQYEKVQTKKRMLTKYLKQAKEHLKDLNDHLLKYLYGELVTYKDIRETENEIIAIKRVYNQLK